MKNLFVGLFVLILSACTTMASDGRFAPDVPEVKRYEVVDDGGGSVTEFQAAIRFIKSTGLGVKVNGYCASACTLLLDEKIGLDVCVTPRASFMFHKPFMVRFGPSGFEVVKTIPSIYQTEKMWTEEFYKRYPQWTRTEIDKNGGVPSVYTGSQPSEMFTIGYDTLKKHMVTCGA